MPRSARLAVAIILAGVAVTAGRGGAIEVCRPNALGQIACQGQPTHGLDPLVVFPPHRPGLPGAGPGPASQTFVSGVRTNRFDQTVLRPGELPPPRPQICRTDNLGNMRCP